MTGRASFTTGVASLARTSLVLFVVALACGGKSIRTVDDGDASAGDGADPAGGASNGGRGGSGAVDPFGGTAFTGGTSTGGTFTGGTFTGGTSGTAGTIAVGGTFTGGTGGTIPIGGTSFTGGTAGTAGTGGCVTTPVVGISWDFDGAIYWNQNPFGINGGWYTFDDCDTAMLAGLPCTVRSPTLIGPDGNRGWTVLSPSAVCASGTAPRVQIGPDGAPAYASQWGFGMGFSLNGGAPFNAAAQCIRGFAFELIGSAPVILRINVVTPKTESVPHFTETSLSQNAFVDFASVRQGAWVPAPSPLDVTQITGIQFHVYTNEVAPAPFDFCVNNVRVLR